MAFSLIVFCYFLLGTFLGRHYDRGPTAPAVGALAGLVIGMVVATLYSLVAA